jgi:SAM-dependent methyltransferase
MLPRPSRRLCPVGAIRSGRLRGRDGHFQLNSIRTRVSRHLSAESLWYYRSTMRHSELASRDGLDPIPRTIDVYERIAGDYARRWFADPVMEPFLDQFISLLTERWDVLDVGCGPGRDVLAMAERGCPAIGIDLSSTMIAEAKSRVPGRVFRQMDMRHLRYPSQTFQGVWACACLQHLTPADAECALAEFSRALVPDGIVGITLEEGFGEYWDHLGRYVKLYRLSELRHAFARAGFDIAKEEVVRSEKPGLGRHQAKTWLQLLARKKRTVAQETVHPEERDLCIFCPRSRFELSRDIPFGGAESILWGDENVWVAPDIAPLAEGHLLMISTTHYNCFGEWPAILDSALLIAKRRVSELLREVYRRPVCFFEHGSVRPGSAGSCIDHAHWHSIPTNLSVREAVEGRLGRGYPASIEKLRYLYQRGQSYVYLEEEPNRAWFYPVESLPCQFLREIVATLQEQANWRWQSASSFPEIQDVRRQMLEKLLPRVDGRSEHPLGALLTGRGDNL